jgi:hypothetical protein
MQPSAPAPSAAAPVPTAPGAQQARSAAAPVAVRLEALAEERQPPSNTPRNPFRYQPKPAPPPTPKPIEAPPADVRPGPDRPVPPPELRPIPLKFIGTLTRADGVVWAALTDGKNLSHGREGDIVDGRYRIVKIGTESIEMTYVDGRGRQVIRLTGQ